MVHASIVQGVVFVWPKIAKWKSYSKLESNIDLNQKIVKRVSPRFQEKTHLKSQSYLIYTHPYVYTS